MTLIIWKTLFIPLIRRNMRSIFWYVLIVIIICFAFLHFMMDPLWSIVSKFRFNTNVVFIINVMLPEVKVLEEQTPTTHAEGVLFESVINISYAGRYFYHSNQIMKSVRNAKFLFNIRLYLKVVCVCSFLTNKDIFY